MTDDEVADTGVTDLQERIAKYLEEEVGETGFPWEWVKDQPEAATWLRHADVILAMARGETR